MKHKENIEATSNGLILSIHESRFPSKFKFELKLQPCEKNESSASKGNCEKLPVEEKLCILSEVFSDITEEETMEYPREMLLG